ncbi:MAG: hypothetical protein VZR53_05300 [Prevotella sp.]|nr:hypothetical protein [Prevotella sp.]
MELLFNIDNYEEKMSSDELTLNETEKKKIINDIAISNVESVEFVNIGAGADCMVVMVVITLLGYEILKAGKYINDGIDGWIKIGNKLKNLFKRNKIISTDSEGATLLAIELISQKEKINAFEVMQEDTINLVDMSGIFPENKGLAAKPFNYFVKTINVNDETLYIIGVNSTGEATIIKRYDVSNGFFYIEEIDD